MATSGVNPFASDLLDSFVDPSTISVPFYPGLYVCFDATGVAIYIGQSKSVPDRLKQHRKKKWYPLVDSVRVMALADEDARLCAEAVLQLRYRPRYCRAIKLAICNDGHLCEIQFIRGK